MLSYNSRKLSVRLTTELGLRDKVLPCIKLKPTPKRFHDFYMLKTMINVNRNYSHFSMDSCSGLF